MQRFITLLLFIVFSISGLVATAQSNIFIKMTDNTGAPINGESTSSTHRNEIEASSFGQENTGCVVNGSTTSASCGGTVGRFIFNMKVNLSLTAINKSLFLAKPLESVEVFFLKPTGASQPQVYYKVKLENVFVTHVTNAIEGDDVGSVQVALDAAKITWTYIPQRPDGSMGTPVVFGWDAVLKRAL